MAQAAVARSLSPTSELSKSYISPRLKGREVFPFGLTAYPNRVGTAEVREENGISAPCGPKPAFAGGVMPAFLLDCSDRRGIRTSVATTNINQPFSGLHFFILNLPLPTGTRACLASLRSRLTLLARQPRNDTPRHTCRNRCIQTRRCTSCSGYTAGPLPS